MPWWAQQQVYCVNQVLTLKNPPWIDYDKKSTSCSTSTSWFTTFFSTCSSSSESLITIIVGVGGEKCCLRPFDVSSSPSPVIAARFKASKISFYMFLSFPKLSLLSWNVGGGLDASSSM